MGDVAEVATWEALVGTARERFGQLDILVHNAAYAVLKRTGRPHRRAIGIAAWA